METILAGASEVIKPSLFGTLIIAVVYLPVLTLTGTEGKMFTPMALTVLMALAGAAMLSVTFVPAAVAIFVTRQGLGDGEHLHAGGQARLRAAARPGHPLPPQRRASVAVLIVAGSLFAATRMGGEFIPSLDEGDVTIEAIRIPGTSLTQSVEMQLRLEKALKQVPEVATVFSKIGTAEIANDPMPPNVADTYVMLKPRDEWPDPPSRRTKLSRSSNAPPTPCPAPPMA